MIVLLLCGAVLHGAAPGRIVSLAPSLTESLFLLGGGDRLVGCTTYCQKPAAARQKEKIGTLVKFNLEKIVTLRPDLVLAMEFADRKAIEKLRQLHIRVELFPSPRDFADLCDSFLRLGEKLGRAEQAKAIIDAARNGVTATRERVKDLPKVTVFWQLGAKPLFTVTRGNFSHDYIEFAGAINIAADAGSGIYSREEVLRKNPDVIVIVTMGLVAEEEKRAWKRYASIDAVKNDRVFIVDSYTYCSPTPTGFATALEELAVLLHPEIKKRP